MNNLRLVVIAALVLVPGIGAAQNYPAKPVRLFIASTAGGYIDRTSRLIADKLAARKHSSARIEKILGGNFLRLCRDVWGA